MPTIYSILIFLSIALHPFNEAWSQFIEGQTTTPVDTVSPIQEMVRTLERRQTNETESPGCPKPSRNTKAFFDSIDLEQAKQSVCNEEARQFHPMAKYYYKIGLLFILDCPNQQGFKSAPKKSAEEYIKEQINRNLIDYLSVDFNLTVYIVGFITVNSSLDPNTGDFRSSFEAWAETNVPDNFGNQTVVVYVHGNEKLSVRADEHKFVFSSASCEGWGLWLLEYGKFGQGRGLSAILLSVLGLFTSPKCKLTETDKKNVAYSGTKPNTANTSHIYQCLQDVRSEAQADCYKGTVTCVERSLCGNGIIEGKEECDCLPFQYVKRGCGKCNPNQCRLQDTEWIPPTTLGPDRPPSLAEDPIILLYATGIGLAIIVTAYAIRLEMDARERYVANRMKQFKDKFKKIIKKRKGR